MASCTICGSAVSASASAVKLSAGSSPLPSAFCPAHTVSLPALSAKSGSSRVASSSAVPPKTAVAAGGDGAAVTTTAAPEAEIHDTSAFISDVSSLIKLVDSRDIVELELKHSNYEILVRKKEAVDAAAATSSAELASRGYQTYPGPHVMAHTAFPFASFTAAPAPAAAAPAPAPAPAAAPAPAPAPAPPAAKSGGFPPMLSPMAGTFYRSPAPGEPAFVKVGDRIQKGQVVCIIEAMKLMNEIEADQSGVVAEIVAEDGKPVSIESPLFIIKP